MPVVWSKDAWRVFKDIERDGPIQMLNLIRYREKAEYDDGRDMSGQAAYAEYGRTSAAVFHRVGGRIIWRGKPEHILIGAPDEHWDLAFIAEYPSSGAFISMLYDEEYQVAVKNRTAGISDSRLIRMKPLTIGENFGE